MNAFKKLRKLIAADPVAESSRILAALTIALETGGQFKLADLYSLDYDAFQLALKVLSEWRLDRYYQSRSRLLATAGYKNDNLPESGGK